MAAKKTTGKYANKNTTAKKAAPAKKSAASTSKKTTAAKKTEKRSTSAAIVSVCATILLLVVLGGSWFFLMGPGTQLFTFQNTTVAGIDLEGMSKEEALAALDKIVQRYASEPMVLTAEGETVTISPAQAACQLDTQALIEEAFAEKPLTVLNLESYLTVNADAVQSAVDALAQAVHADLQQPSYYQDGDTLYITLGSPSCRLDTESLYTAVLNAYANLQFSTEGTCSREEPDHIDLNALYSEYCIDPVDAAMDESYAITDGVPGYGFDMAEAESALSDSSYGETITLAMGEKQPAITAQDLWNDAFPDTLSTCSTPYTSNEYRNTNLRLACKAVDGMILYPGDIFSFNEALGERTPEKGYLPGASYEGGKTVYTYGGGICQVSSTLYYCTLYADLEIVERWCHMYTPDYIDWGIDATVSWGTLDYQFRNNTDHPIKIEANAEDGYVTVTFYGTDTKSYYVEMENEIVAVFNYETVYKELPPDNEEGYEDGEVIDWPITGYGVDTYRNKYDKATGELISSDYEDYSDYDHRDHVICKIVQPETQPPETQPPETQPPETQPPETQPPETQPAAPETEGEATPEGDA